MIKVSIIVPIYNVEPYIERCVQSVMKQTYHNIECILVDDCSPDNSMTIIARMLAEYHGPITFIIMHHNHNRGLSAARNTGTNAATGEYIFYLDSDDFVTSDCINTLIIEAIKHPCTEMICGRSEPADKVYSPEENVRFNNNKDIQIRYLSPKQEFPIPAWNKLVKRDFILKNNLFFKEGILHEDVLWTFLTIQHLSSVIILTNSTYIYFQHEKSITSDTTNLIQRANSLMVVYEKIIQTATEPFYTITIYKFIERLLEWYPYSSKNNHKVFWLYSSALFNSGYKKDSFALIIYRFFWSIFRQNKISNRIQQHFTYRYRHEFQKHQNEN